MSMGEWIVSGVLAFSVGIGCGTCCSPFVSGFLSAYVLSNGEGIRKSLKIFLCFFSGKLSGILVLCLASAGIGRQLLSENGWIGAFPFRLAVQMGLSLLGLYWAVRWLVEQKNDSDSQAFCIGTCGQCPEHRCKDGKEKACPLFSAGVLYGITPCPPLVMVLGYCVNLSVFAAGMTGICFGMATMIGPFLMLAVILGVLSKRIRREIPDFLRWFRFGSYVLLTVLPFTLER